MKFLIYLLALVASATSQSNSDILKAINTNFTADLFQEVIKEESNRSVVLSALSSLSLLTQLAEASEELTRDRILTALGITNDTEVIIDQMAIANRELQLAGSLYASNSSIIIGIFINNSSELYTTVIVAPVFPGNEQIAQKINSLIENNTNGKIKSMISPHSLGASTAAVLVNSVSYKGKWSKPFNPRYTVNGFFYVSRYETIKLRFMCQRNTFKYGESEELNAKLLELPYETNQWSFLVILPNKYDGINTLIEKLKDPSIVSRAIENMRFREVRVAIPRFKIETCMDLKRTRITSIAELFTNAANQRDIMQSQNKILISKAVQKVYIEVNEEGSEAAGGNEFTMVTRPRLRRQLDHLVYFTANRPFYFAQRMDDMDVFNGIFVK